MAHKTLKKGEQTWKLAYEEVKVESDLKGTLGEEMSHILGMRDQMFSISKATEIGRRK